MRVEIVRSIPTVTISNLPLATAQVLMYVMERTGGDPSSDSPRGHLNHLFYAFSKAGIIAYPYMTMMPTESGININVK